MSSQAVSDDKEQEARLEVMAEGVRLLGDLARLVADFMELIHGLQKWGSKLRK